MSLLVKYQVRRGCLLYHDLKDICNLLILKNGSSVVVPPPLARVDRFNERVIVPSIETDEAFDVVLRVGWLLFISYFVQVAQLYIQGHDSEEQGQVSVFESVQIPLAL